MFCESWDEKKNHRRGSVRDKLRGIQNNTYTRIRLMNNYRLPVLSDVMPPCKKEIFLSSIVNEHDGTPHVSSSNRMFVIVFRIRLKPRKPRCITAATRERVDFTAEATWHANRHLAKTDNSNHVPDPRKLLAGFRRERSSLKRARGPAVSDAIYSLFKTKGHGRPTPRAIDNRTVKRTADDRVERKFRVGIKRRWNNHSFPPRFFSYSFWWREERN